MGEIRFRCQIENYTAEAPPLGNIKEILVEYRKGIYGVQEKKKKASDQSLQVQSSTVAEKLEKTRTYPCQMFVTDEKNQIVRENIEKSIAQKFWGMFCSHAKQFGIFPRTVSKDTIRRTTFVEAKIIELGRLQPWLAEQMFQYEKTGGAGWRYAQVIDKIVVEVKVRNGLAENSKLRKFLEFAPLFRIGSLSGTVMSVGHIKLLGKK